MIEDFIEYITERYTCNQDAKNITDLLFDEINNRFDELLSNKKLILTSVLENNYKSLIFINDIIEIHLSDRDYGRLDKCQIKNNIILTKIYIEYKIKESEKIIKRLLKKSKIRNTINHEFNHVVEYYHSEKMSDSWDIAKKITILREKYKDDKIDNILHILYLSQPHEIRSRISSLYEDIKDYSGNTHNFEIYIKTLVIYKELKYLSMIEPELLLKNIKDNDIIDIMNTLFNIDKNHRKEFIKYFNKLKISNDKMLEKILKSYYYLFENYICDDDFSKKIDFLQYLPTDSNN